MKIYQAGPLFTAGEQAWHRQFKEKLMKAGHDVTWPFELIDQKDVIAWGDKAPQKIMEIDKAAIDQVEVIVALLDGTQVDDGTAWEIGYAYAKGLPIIGIRTDFRQAGDTKHSAVNAMIEGSCLAICQTEEDVIEALKHLG